MNPPAGDRQPRVRDATLRQPSIRLREAATQSVEMIVLALAETWQAQKCGCRRLLRSGTAPRFNGCQLPVRLKKPVLGDARHHPVNTQGKGRTLPGPGRQAPRGNAGGQNNLSAALRP